MSEIQEERIKILNEASRRMKYQDYSDMPFADQDELVQLYRAKSEWCKKLKTGAIVIDGELSDYQKRQNEIIDLENKRIEETYIKPLEFKIKILEVELILFNGLFEISEIENEIYNRSYPKSKN